MKLQLKTVTSAVTEISVNPADKVGSIHQILVNLQKLQQESSVKLIHGGIVLDHDKCFADYPKIMENPVIVYVARKVEAHAKPAASAPVPAPNAAAATTAVPEESHPYSTTAGNSLAQLFEAFSGSDAPGAPDENPVSLLQSLFSSLSSLSSVAHAPANTSPEALPASIGGVTMEDFRHQAVTAVLTQVLQNRSLFSLLLSQNPQMAQLRAADTAAFDNIIYHPNFMSPDTHMDEDQDNALSQLSVTLEEKAFLENINSMAPHISLNEILQCYLVCDRNRDHTIEMVLGLSA